MKALVVGAATAVLGYGLWEHDWRLILAGALVALIWPLIRLEVDHGETARQKKRRPLR